MTRPLALVTDGMWRKSLSAIRALGRAGFDVHVAGDSWLTTGFWSRFTAGRHRLPDAADDADAFGAGLLTLLDSLATNAGGQKPVLLPMEDATLTWVLQHRAEVAARAHLLIPSDDAYAVCADKGATLALAARVGVPHPTTHTVGTGTALLQAVRALAPAEFIVKPVKGSGSRGLLYNPTFDQAGADAYISRHGEAVVQERVPAHGDAVGVSLLFDAAGTPVAHFVHKRLRQFPNSGGPSTDRIGIDHPQLLELSIRLLQAVGWRGIAMVEWKVDPVSGEPRLMEVNPRFWGSLELAVRSGVDFPTLYTRAARGETIEPVTPLLGVRCRWLLPGDVLRWLTAPAGQREGLGAFLAGLPGSAEEWDAQDLRGALSALVCQAAGALRPKYLRMLRR